MSMTLIATATASGSTATIEIASIPQNYTDLYAVYNLRCGTSNVIQATFFIFNDDGTGYTGKVLYGSGSGAASFSRTSSEFAISNGTNSTAGVFSSGSAYIPNYTSSTYKSVSFDNVVENNATLAEQNIASGLWSNTSAITKITIFTGSANFEAGSTFSLYGISRQSAIGKPRALGGAITFANGFWYHTFTGSGTLTTQENINCDVLLVAGGGGGGSGQSGSHYGGGGGAGGLVVSSAVLEKNQSYYAMVGAGGVASASANITGVKGIDSSFGNLIANGGGGGSGGFQAPTGGGSGGGGAYPNFYNGATGIAGQGNRGGNYYSGGAGAPGGGAGTAGADSSSTANNGALIGFSASTIKYSTGGDGIPSGAGGGANTGNGGKGGRPVGGEEPGSGGSGIVIIRYPAN